ncbi:MAG: indolepyruvate oxidoreductase subunit beta [Candidatus Freyarchaeota archaeon]|nr:indolepyruvate oxidoreductase subunit beta [Candidatus Jordarchaeia archaeon]MBS7268424.1 indolepyruvate oxidoreductase subunit beta [Candidatus Jordarchaeia archaeon]MBS7279362.1 indolepyruvate oxidoreductase subunit beta [Candidatus Jordarchaeia archaeon]
MKKNFDILIAGVGGQGGVLTSRIIGDAAIEAGYHVTVGETFGASQRGGSVITHIRLGKERIYGPLIPEASGDAVIGLEPLESLKCAVKFLKSNGIIVTNERPVLPPDKNYPELNKIFESARKIPAQLFSLDSIKLAKGAGDILSSNIVMIGAAYAVGALPIEEEYLKNSIRSKLPKAVDLNLRAFELGKKAMEKK